MKNQVIQGDCLEVMKDIPDNSVDSICCDPPYELGFMGKAWDNTGIANNPLMWSECLRVLKPGGYLLSFGGTRTYHRMASAIEDAGFEVRDMIEWVYGCLSEDTEILTANGWKMLYSVFEGDYVFACDYKNDMKLQLEPVKQKFIYDYDEDAYHIKDIGYYNSELMETDHIVSKNHNVLVLESWVRNNGFGNDLYYEKIQAEKLYEYIKKTNGKETFRIPGLNGDIPCTIEKIPYKGKVWCVEVESGAFVARRKGKIFITGNSGFPKSLNIGKSVDKLQGNEREVIGTTRGVRGADGTGQEHAMPGKATGIKQIGIDLPLTKGTSEWEGWGTALKPSHEPICMARKPLAEKTVAENCLKWGTGGINIDESRVEIPENDKENYEFNNNGLSRMSRPEGDKLGQFDGGWKIDKTKRETPHGRFPANLLHDNSEEVRECFPESTSGARKRGDHKEYNASSYKFGGLYSEDVPAESGNASRFFKSIIYQAKASKSERNKGCEGLEEKPKVFNGQSDKPSTDMKDVEKRFTTMPKANNHPTVKPLKLMEYLIKMITPKGGIVLDPFAGSGTTGVACKNTGRNYILIEKEPEYIDIINKRLSIKENK